MALAALCTDLRATAETLCGYAAAQRGVIGWGDEDSGDGNRKHKCQGVIVNAPGVILSDVLTAIAAAHRVEGTGEGSA